ncbi:hypothetical protein FSARC_6312 [Fusarium sarcochroum]|uniref:Uncharacterized protein n=1 Tax=Fusarium sarcochroum TaxID=1208366 RepID=A0A8H4TXE9_9HYPO|nr:hypothetical protein FSARC_6312 [Fusarium sarcochroum]
MDNSTHLLGLPFELRDLIWTLSASTGDANGLLRCCRQTRDEFAPYCVLPDDIHQLHKLRMLVDSTYDHGIWLKFDYYWEYNGHIRHATGAVQDMDDPIARRLSKMEKVNDLILHLHASRRGHFVGALLMMLAKAEDVYRLINVFAWRLEHAQGGVGRYTIRFSTETIQPGQSKKEAKNFWECRSPKALEDTLRKYLKDAGQMPCFYEYFLINWPYGFPAIPKIEYITWPRRHVHRHHTPSVPEYKLRRRPSFGGKNKHNSPDELRNYQKDFAGYSAMLMTICRFDTSDETRYEHWSSPPESLNWEHINYDTLNLKSRYQFLLDNLTGPAGGCLDMLRLHRFRTMDASVFNFFARSEKKAMKDNTGLAGANSKINRRLRALFYSCATYDIRNLRSTCPHLRGTGGMSG